MFYWRITCGRGVVIYILSSSFAGPWGGMGLGPGLIFSCGGSMRKILIELIFSKYIRWDVILIKTTSA